MTFSRLVKLGDSAVEVQTTGSGSPTFVVTHPFQSSPDESALVRTLSSFGRCVYVVPRGLGRSRAEPDPSKLGIGRLVDDIDRVRDALDVASWIFVGQSGGGYVALDYALRYGSSLRGLILSCTSADAALSPESVYHPDNPEAARAQAALAEGRRGVLTELIARRPERVSHERRESSAERQAAFRRELPTMNLAQQLGKVCVPTLVVAGKYDRAMPPAHGRALADGIAGSRFVLFEDSGHFPYEEEPERWLEVIGKFVAMLEER